MVLDIPVGVGCLPERYGSTRRLAATDSTPGHGHHIGLAVLIVTADDQDRVRLDNCPGSN